MSPLLPVSAAMAATVWASHKAYSFSDVMRVASTTAELPPPELGETQTDDLLRLQAGLPRIK